MNIQYIIRKYCYSFSPYAVCIAFPFVIGVAWKDQEVITYKESELKRFNVACGQFEDQKLGEGLPNSTFFCCLTSKDLLLMVPDYRWYSLFSNTSFQKI